MDKSTTQHELHLAKEDLVASRSYCSRHGLPWSSLCKLAWVVLNCVYQGESNVPTGIMNRNKVTSKIDFVIIQVEIDTDTIISQIFECISRPPDATSMRADSVIEIFNAIAEQKTNCGSRILVMADNLENDYDPGSLRRLSSIAPEPISTCATMVTKPNGDAIFQVSTMPDSRGRNIPAEDLAHCFIQIMSSIASTEPSCCIGDLHAVGDEVRSAIVKSNTRDIQAAAGCVHELIDDYARSNPDKMALELIDPSKNLSYGRLSRLSTALAVVFRERGIYRGDAVPSLFEKGQHTVLATLATLKAGGAYVGLNSESPIAMMKHAIETVEAKIVLTSRMHEASATLLGIPIIVIDDGLISELDNREIVDASPVCCTHPTDLAMFALTSGSTGKPKAASIEHRSLVSWAMAVRRKGWFYEDMRALHFSAPNFDGYPKETLIVLLTGGTICMPTEEGRLNDVPAMIRILKADWFGATPSLLRTFHPFDVPNLKLMGVWGEAVPQDVVDRWQTATMMINSYGPAECTISSSVNIYGKGGPGSNNIGEPLDCAAYWVVSPWNHNRLVPFGAVGELMIQGAGVSRGYKNNPTKTKESFIFSPEWAPDYTEWNRFYRTGDLVRQLPDLSFEYIGRMDKQVKLNGQRLELGEVETAVKKALKGEFVVAVELVQPFLDGKVSEAPQPSSTRLLTAFFATRSAHSAVSASDLVDTSLLGDINLDDLQHVLQRYLRPFAIPRLIVPLRILPLTPIGKLDRKMLQTVGSNLDADTIQQCSGTRSKKDNDILTTPTELALQPLISQVLNINAQLVTKSSNFFLLGGDSVRAIELVSLGRSVGMTLTVPMILVSPCFSDLAASVRLSTNNAAPSAMYSPFDTISALSSRQSLIDHATDLYSTIRTSRIQDIFPATDYQSSCVAWTTLQQHGAINWLIYDVNPPQSPSHISQMCNRLVEDEPMLRAGYISHARQLFHVIFESFEAPLRTIDAGDERNLKIVTEQEIAADLTRSIDIIQPQTAFILCRKRHGVSRLMIRLCHAQYDGQSIGILRQRMTDMLNGRYVRESEASFAQYLHQARLHEHESGKAYWQQLLKNAEMTPLTISSCERAPVWLQTADRAIIRSTPTSLFSPSRGIHANTATLVQTAWALTLAKASGKLDIVFGATTWGRGAPVKGATTVFGSLLSHVPVRVRIEIGESFKDLLNDVHQQRAESMQYESIGANTIVEECTSWPRWTRFSSLVVFQGLEIVAKESGPDGGQVVVPSNEVNMQYVEEMVSPSDRTDLLLHVAPRPDNTTRTTLRFSSKRFSDAAVCKIVDTFLDFVSILAKSPLMTINGECFDQPILPSNIDYPSRSYIPNSEPNGESQEDPSRASIHRDIDSHSSPSAAAAAASVAAAWTDVLDLTNEQTMDCRANNRSCMAEWGNIMCCASLADHYRRQGYDVGTEAIMNAQTMLQQEALLCSRT